MNRAGTILLIVWLIAVAGLLEGAETGIYRISRLRLRLAVERGQWSALLLADAMRDSPGLLLSLLLGVNLVDYLATSLVTGLFLDLGGTERRAELYTMVVAGPLLFVFANLIPKNVFLQGANRLTLFVAPLLYVSQKGFTWCGAVPLLKWVTHVFGRLVGAPAFSRAGIATGRGQQTGAILRDTREEGLLSEVQTAMLDRLATILSIRLSMVMVPLERVQSVNLDSDRAALLSQLAQRASTRLPVWRNTPTEIVGFIDVYDVLGTGEEFTSLEKFLVPIRSLDADTPVTDVINIMRREQLKIVLVTRRHGRREVPLGIVTMKDLVEELLGELAEW